MKVVSIQKAPPPSPYETVMAGQEAQIAVVRLSDQASKLNRIVARPMTVAAQKQAREALCEVVAQATVLRRLL